MVLPNTLTVVLVGPGESIDAKIDSLVLMGKDHERNGTRVFK